MVSLSYVTLVKIMHNNEKSWFPLITLIVLSQITVFLPTGHPVGNMECNTNSYKDYNYKLIRR